MHVGAMIKRMFPEATLNDFEVVNGEITNWNLTETKPTRAELEAFWEENEESIIAEQATPPFDPLAELQKQQTDLIFELMMKGVL